MEKRLSLLIIGLSENDTELVLGLFQEADYAVSHQCVEAAGNIRPHLATGSWDLVMADSPFLLPTLRESGTDIPYIVISGESDAEKAIEAMKYGIDDYIIKGSLRVRLIPALEQALEKAVLRRQKREAEERNRQAVQELQNSETLYRTMALQTSSGIAILQNGKIVFVNPYVTNYYGYEEGDFIGRAMLDFIHPEDRAGVRQNAIRMLKGQSQTPYRYRVVSKTGQLRWVVETITAISYMGKRAIMGNVIDVTELMQLTKQLDDARTMLIQEEKLSSIGMLAGGISHEILNPLNIISLNIQLLEMNDWPADKTGEMLAVISHQVERIEKIVRDINTFAKPSKGEFLLLDVNRLIESVFNLITPKLRLAMISLEKQLAPDLPEIPIDQNKMWQVFMNIISNAIDAMTGRPEKILRAATTLETTRDGGFIVIIFSDTGPGIGKEAVNKIFDPFYTTKEPGTGTGLGLSISYSIIQEHQGNIMVKNNEWGGASFIIRLPVKPQRRTAGS
ncbi:MAG: two-component system sensor histidine kinase NtrB [Syntrophales bacterium]